jgi:Bacterial toxin 44
MGSRWYDPDLGRFTQPDTIVPGAGNPQSLNRYAYVHNNPLNLLDPSGHSDEDPDACQPWDNWCWENRYWNALGKCYNPKREAWTRECAPTIRDEGIMEEIAEKEPAILLRDDVQTPFDPSHVVAFIWKMMIRDALYSFSVLRPLNECPPWATSCVAARASAAAAFGWLNYPWDKCNDAAKVAGCGAWDFKHTILADYGGLWQQVNATLYSFDTWTNIHYGFVGMAAGFSRDELLDNAGLAQIAGGNPEPAPPGSPWRAYDDPLDQAAITVGLDLWANHGSSLTVSNIVDAVEAAKHRLNSSADWLAAGP